VASPDVFLGTHQQLMFALAIQARLPTVGPLRRFAEAGALVSYGSNFEDFISPRYSLCRTRAIGLICAG
jgi:hypothetical protein